MKNVLLVCGLIALFTVSSCKKELVDTSQNQITDIDDLTAFNESIASGVSLVFFHASWCSICAEERPHVEAASKNADVSFAQFIEIEYDDNKNIFSEYNVEGFPQILIFKDGTEQTRLKGKGHDESKLVNLILSYK